MPNFARWHGFADYKGYLSSSFKGTSRVCHLGHPRYARSTLFISLPLWQTWQQVAVSMIGLRSSLCLYQTSFKPLWCCFKYMKTVTLLIFFFSRLNILLPPFACILSTSALKRLRFDLKHCYCLFSLDLCWACYLFFVTCLNWTVFFCSLDMAVCCVCYGWRFLGITLQK